MLSLRLPEDIELRLDALAKKAGRSKSYFARPALIEHIEDLEDAQLALEALRDDDGLRLSLTDVKRELEADENAHRSAAE